MRERERGTRSAAVVNEALRYKPRRHALELFRAAAMECFRGVVLNLQRAACWWRRKQFQGKVESELFLKELRQCLFCFAAVRSEPFVGSKTREPSEDQGGNIAAHEETHNGHVIAHSRRVDADFGFLFSYFQVSQVRRFATGPPLF